MKIPKGLYDILKYIALIGGPGLATFIMVVGPVWDWGHVDAVVKTIVSFDALLGTLLVLNSAQYTKEQKVASLMTDAHPNDLPAAMNFPPMQTSGTTAVQNLDNSVNPTAPRVDRS